MSCNKRLPYPIFKKRGLRQQVGQELLAYAYPHMKSRLFYWERSSHESEAEIDYVVQENEHIVPIEVKSGKSAALFSMHAFLNSHRNSPYGIRFSPRNYSIHKIHENIYSYPLYAIAGALPSFAERVQRAIMKTVIKNDSY